jgi:ketosteroid isomerase-like protein
MKDDLIAKNLAAVEAHFHSEAANEVDEALKLYTDDIVWESPVRNLVFRGKAAVGENYRKMFASFTVEEFRCLQRFATEDRVVDDSVLTLVLSGNAMEDPPVPVGSQAEIRLLHIFEMRDGKISRELVFEDWKVLQPAVHELSFNVSKFGAPVKAVCNGIILSPATRLSSNLPR